VSKLERLLNLTAALLDTPRPLLIEEIRERVEGYPDGDDAFKRSFERDKDELRTMGIPVTLAPVPGTDPPREGYRVDRREYAGADPQLAADELAALHLAATFVRLDGVDGEDALRRLGGLVDTGVGAQGPVADLPTPPGLGPLFAAARDARAVTFGYGDDTRRLEPWTVTFAKGRWYVAGFDQVRGAERRFRVDRILGDVTDTGSAAEPRPSTRRDASRLAAWQMGDDEPVRALVAIDADQAPWATHHLGADAVVDTHDDGSVVVALDVTNREALRSFVLTFLEHAEILEPAELRDDMTRWLEARIR